MLNGHLWDLLRSTDRKSVGRGFELRPPQCKEPARPVGSSGVGPGCLLVTIDGEWGFRSDRGLAIEGIATRCAEDNWTQGISPQSVWSPDPRSRCVGRPNGGVARTHTRSG